MQALSGRFPYSPAVHGWESGINRRETAYSEDELAHSYTEFYFHFAWATKMREPMITAEIEQTLHAYIHKHCKEFGVITYAFDGIADHRHLVCSIPPTIAVADFIEKLKGASSHYINHVDGKNWSLYWQPGYGGFTFAKKDLARVVTYVENQKKHHADGTLWPTLQRFDDRTLSPSTRNQPKDI